MAKKKVYIEISRDTDGSWQFRVQKKDNSWKIRTGYSTAKVAALMRDEYILRERRNSLLRVAQRMVVYAK